MYWGFVDYHRPSQEASFFGSFANCRSSQRNPKGMSELKNALAAKLNFQRISIQQMRRRVPKAKKSPPWIIPGVWIASSIPFIRLR